MTRNTLRKIYEIKPEDKLLTPAELGEIMRIEPRQIARWAQQGRIRYTRTIGGHRRYFLSDVITWQSGGIPEGWDINMNPDPRKNRKKADVNGSTD